MATRITLGRTGSADRDTPPAPHTVGPTRSVTTAFSDRGYQIEAVDRITTALGSGGRGQLRAACGTGKTRMAQAAAERLVPHGGVLVIVAPTVGLVAQTLEVWSAGHDDHRALAVCSDTSVNDDHYGSTDDILEPVTTDSDVVDAWLRMPNTAAIRLIVGTHASAHVIGEGLHKAGVAADLLVIDEAHRTSGWIGKHTALLHDDEVLPALRRLYMTATARIFESSKNNDTSTLSMDDESVFGPVLFSYPFSQAIDEGWLDDYRLVVIGVTRAEVLAVLRNAAHRVRSKSLLPDEHTAMVQAATARAAAELGLRRVIAFCPRVEDAQRFADTFHRTLDALPEGVRPRRGLHTAHVRGSMKQARRREVLHTLAHPPHDGWTVISNARCLSEGIDVPTVDGIAFTAPKNSTVDIVQAIGRALRRDPEGSGTATVIVPILLSDDSTDDDRIDAGDFRTLWQVVRGLAAHDDTFGTSLDAYRAGHFRGSAVQERIDFILPESHRNPEFLEHLTIRLVKGSTSKWWDGYAHLADFHAREGHTRVNHLHVTDDLYNLGAWVSSTRTMYHDKRLGPDRVAALRKLDFVFDARAADWEHAFAVAAAYYRDTGTLRPPSKFRDNDVRLAPWLTKQRNACARGTLAEDRQARLTAIGMEWETPTARTDRLPELRAYHAQHGHLPDGRPYTPLSAALAHVRAARRRGELSPDVIAELDELGMGWDTPVVDWWDGFARLAGFHEREGHSLVRQGHVTDDGFQLGAWVANTRNAHREHRLPEDRIDVLRKVDFVFDTRGTAWEHAFAVAEAFHSEHGDLRPPTGYRSQDVHLAAWLDKQRSARIRGTLPADREARLTSIGMDWAVAAPWKERLPELRAYHTEHGQLPDRGSFTPVSGALRTIQAACRRGELDPELVDELNRMGMIWTASATDWWDGYDHLVRFHEREGNSLVKQGHVTDDGFPLGAWVRNTRRAHRQDRLDADRVAALDRLGFVVDVATTKWERNFTIAAAFFGEHGHLRTQRGCHYHGIDLASWLSQQRQAHKQKTLKADRQARLDAIGMQWQVRVTWEDRLPDLRDYYTRHKRLPTENTDRALAAVLRKARAARRREELSPEAIAALDTLGMNWNPIPEWEDGYAHLAQFHEREGHTQVEQGHTTDDGFDLGTWVATNRKAYRDRRLEPGRVEALDALGFSVDLRTTNWDHAYSVAAAFHADNGHLRPPPDFRSQNVTLGPWLSRQRVARKQSTLAADRQKRLDAIGMEWQLTFTWEDRLSQLRDYHAEHGRLPTQQSHTALGAVLTKLRAARKNGELTDELIAALDELGMNWNPRPEPPSAPTSTWKHGIAVATRFRQRHGHLDVRPADQHDQVDTEFDLNDWIRTLRGEHRNGKLTPQQIRELDALGMIWDVHQAAWDHSLAACAAFHTEHGHLRVPHRHQARNSRGEPYRLVNWINVQRGKRNQLTPAQVSALDALGMDWDPAATRWKANLAALTRFHAEHGHLDIPTDLTADTGTRLAGVLSNCRVQHRKGELPPDRVQALDALGIDWDPGTTGAWQRMLEALQSYHEEHGDILVPADYCTDKGNNVADWLTLQRKRRANDELSDAHIADLDKFGMIWEKGRSRWARTLASLQNYHARHGHINITHKDADNDPEARRLYGLLHQLRTARGMGTLPAYKVTDLDNLGIDWVPVHTRERSRARPTTRSKRPTITMPT